MKSMKKSKKQPVHSPKFYGTTVVGERGQAVIPAEAREALNLKKGEKLLVFGMGNGMLSLSTLSGFEQFHSYMDEQAKMIRSIIKKSR